MSQFMTDMLPMFKQMFGQQQQLYQFLSSKLQPLVNFGKSGFLPEEEAAIRTSASEQISTAFQNAQRGVLTRNQQLLFGGGMPSGATAQLLGGIQAQEATQQATAGRDITIEGAQLGREQSFAAANMLAGLGGQTMQPINAGLGALGSFGGQASNIFGSAGNLMLNASKSPFLDFLSSAGAGILGGLGGGLAGRLMQPGPSGSVPGMAPGETPGGGAANLILSGWGTGFNPPGGEAPPSAWGGGFG